jgi:hypothetical protein
MRAYRCEDTNIESPATYVGTTAESKDVVKAETGVFRHNILVTEVEVQTDKEGILAILNCKPIVKDLRSWRGTARGGLKLQGGDPNAAEE